MLKEFRQFILRGNVVDLAIAVVIGASFNSVVQAFVRDLITPFIALIGGKSNFSQDSFVIHGTTFSYGDFLNLLVSFLLTATVVFFFVVQPVNHLITLVKGNEPTVPTTRQCPECKSDIPLDASRCKYCTAKVAPKETSEEVAARIANAA